MPRPQAHIPLGHLQHELRCIHQALGQLIGELQAGPRRTLAREPAAALLSAMCLKLAWLEKTLRQPPAIR